MIYLTRMLGKPVIDASGNEIGHISDIAIATGEIFPRVTSLAFSGPDKTPFMLSWRKYVDSFDGDDIKLRSSRSEIRFSYLQPDEVLLARDLLNKQIVDTQGMKVVRVNDLKLSESKNQFRLLGAEVGARGILRGISPAVERAAEGAARVFGLSLPERLIAWNYMDLLDRDLSHVHLSVTHKRLHELHPADVADILEQLSPSQRARVFEHLENEQAADTISELEDEYQVDVIGDLTNQRASDILEMMDPDDAADILGDLPYDKKETLLRLMGVKEAREVRKLLGYRENTAGGIMTPEVTTVTEEMTVQDVIDHIRGEAAENENIYYIYVVDEDRTLAGVISLRQLIMSQPETPISDIVEHDVFTVGVDTDQEDVAEMMSKYDLLAMPVVDETGKIAGMVTVDDALDVLEEESAEDLALATGSDRPFQVGFMGWFGKKSVWLIVWLVLGAGVAMVLQVFSAVITSFVAAVLFLPLVLRVSEEISSHSMATLIEAGEKPSLGRQFTVDMVVGAVIGLVTALIAFGVLELLGRPLEESLVVALSIALTVVVVSLLGVGLPWLALRGDGGWRAPTVLVTAALSAAGIAVYMALVAILRDVVRL